MSDLQHLPLSKIAVPPKALRLVDEVSEKFAALVEAVKSHGILNPISVRPNTERQTDDEPEYWVVDGAHRFTAAAKAGLESIPASIKNRSELEALSDSIMGNLHHIQTKPVEYSRALRRLLDLKPSLTLKEIADGVGYGVQWVKDRLSLNDLHVDIAPLVDDEKIPLTSAYALVKLPPEEQLDYAARAMSESPNTLLPAINARAKEISEAARKGRNAKPAVFEATPTLRSVVEIRTERDAGDFFVRLTQESPQSVMDPRTTWETALNYALKLDPITYQERKSEYERRQQQLAAEKEARKKERELKKQQEADARAAALSAELDAAATP